MWQHMTGKLLQLSPPTFPYATAYGSATVFHLPDVPLGTGVVPVMRPTVKRKTEAVKQA